MWRLPLLAVDLHPPKSNAFSRRTVSTVIAGSFVECPNYTSPEPEGQKHTNACDQDCEGREPGSDDPTQNTANHF
jgi:hypothetical protein